MKRSKLVLGIAVIAGLTFASCEKDFLKEQTIRPGSSGNAHASAMTIKMTDAPAAYEALEIEIESVEVYQEGQGWVMLNNEAQMVSVLELTNGAETEIAANSNLSAGSYTMLKITLGDDNRLTTNGALSVDLLGISADALVDLEFESESDKEIIIEIDQQLEADSQAELLVDFNVAESVVENGEEYMLDPTVTLIADASTGIQGSVQGAANAAIIVTSDNDSFSAYTNAQGQFLVRGMGSGTYNVLIDYTDTMAAGVDTMTESSTMIEAVAVVEGEITQMGSINLE